MARTTTMARVVPSSVTVECCYCGADQRSPPPPCLHTCVKCGRDFRVLRMMSGSAPIELKKEAKKFYEDENGNSIA